MGIVPRFSKQDILNETEKGKLKIERGIISTLMMAGEQFVSDARENLNVSGAFPKGDYTDRTANLRSSIGYFVLKNGDIIHENLLGTGEGERAAKEVLSTITDKSGYMLVGVAGMDYAGYVEAKGYNVITSQADVTMRFNIPIMLMKLRDRINKMGSDVDVMGDVMFTSTHSVEG